jgi:hypothetical protein
MDAPNPRAAATLESLADSWPDLQFDTDDDGTTYFNIEHADGTIHGGIIPADDSRVIWHF